MKRRTVMCRIACAAAVAVAVPAAAQTYPSKPIRMIVPYPPGGGSDLAARMIGQKLSESLGKQIVIDNRGGAAGVIGTELVARATHDGYTLLFAVSTFIVAPLLGKVPYDPFADFEPVTLVAVNPYLLAGHAALPASSIKELIALAKAQPGKLNYASSGTGGPNHLAMELFKSMTGTDIVHVPYKGAGPAITDLLAGHVQLLFNPMPPFLPHVKSGKLKALAMSGTERSAAMPEVPTIAESGVPGYQYVSWYAVFAPANTPKNIIEKLSSEIGRALGSPEISRRFASQGFEPRSSTPQELAGFMRDDSERLRKVIRVAGIKVE